MSVLMIFEYNLKLEFQSKEHIHVLLQYPCLPDQSKFTDKKIV